MLQNLDNPQSDVATSDDNIAEKLFIQGVENLQINLADAMQDFAKSAEQDFAKAQYNIGLAYVFSLVGFEKNLDLAKAYLQKSAEQEFRPAHFVLAWLYQTEENIEKAVWHYQKAGELGHAQAQYFCQKCMRLAMAWQKMMKYHCLGYASQQNRAILWR